jgi:hypothetical protein
MVLITEIFWDSLLFPEKNCDFKNGDFKNGDFRNSYFVDLIIAINNQSMGI